MNGRTAKLLRRVARGRGRTVGAGLNAPLRRLELYEELKRRWRRTPRPQRAALRLKLVRACAWLDTRGVA